MKFYKQNKKKILIFLSIIAFSILCTIPVYFKISSVLKSEINKILLNVEEKTNLKINFKSVSPSILTGIKISSISISDSKQNKKIFEVDNCYFEYNLLNIFGKSDEIFEKLNIDGINFNFDRNTDFHIFETIKKTLEDNKILSEKTEKSEKIDKKFVLDDIKLKLPFDVSVKNVRLNYFFDNSSVSVVLKQIFFDFRQFDKSLSVSIDGNVYAKLNDKNYSGKFSTSGFIQQEIENSSLIFRISNFSDGNFTIGRLNFLLEYKNSEISVKTIQNNFPLFLLAKFNFENSKVSASFKTKNLPFSSLVINSKNNEIYQKLKNSFLTVDLNAEYELNSKKILYSSLGNFKYFNPENNFVFDFSLFGNEKKINFSNINVLSSFLDLNFSGDFEFKKLALSGIADVKKVELKSGGIISTEIYFDSLEKGFMAFAPEVFLGDKVFTALELNVRPQNDSVDVDFEVSDYSNKASNEPGLIKFGGAFIPKDKYFQANLSVSNFFADSILKTGFFFIDSENKNEFKNLEKYSCNGEFFVSSDFKSVSFNVPYAYVANIKNDNEFLYLSLDGNNNSIQISRFDYIRNGKKASATAQIDKNPDASDYFVNLGLNFNSIPYNLTGSIMPGVVSFAGDYGTSLEFYKSQKDRFDGSVSFENLPISFNDSVFSFSLDSALNFSKKEGLHFQIANLSVSETTSVLSFKPKFNLKGEVNNDGFLMNEVIYSDSFSSLSGTAIGTWNINDGIFENANFDLNVKDLNSAESILISANVSNPELKVVNSKNFKEFLYVNSQIVLNSFDLNRFTVEESENNELSASLVFTGTLQDPYFGLEVSNAQVSFVGNFITTNFTTFFENKKLSVSDFYLKYNNIEVKDFIFDLDFNTFLGEAKSSVFIETNKEPVSIPLELSIFNSKKKDSSILPESFRVKLESKNVTGPIFKKSFGFEINALYKPEEISFFTSDFIGISGKLLKNGDLFVNSAKDKAVSFNAQGNIGSKDLFFSVSNVDIKLGKIFENLSIELLNIYKGNLVGEFLITGLKTDPYFNGNLYVENLDFELPTFVANRLYSEKIPILMEHNEFFIPTSEIHTKKNNQLFAEAKIIMDRWSLDRIEGNINTNNEYFPADFKVRVARFTGKAKFNLNLILQSPYIDVTGDLFVQDVKAKVLTRNLLLTKPPVKKIFTRTDIDIYFGPHVNFQFDPILRCVFSPDNSFNFKFSEEDTSFALDGIIELRTGDITYLNRNFYLKQGVLKFNDRDPEFNPTISVKAETREKDESGNDVTIIMSVENQPLMDFSPTFSSVPAKSETEIRTILGEIVKGDSDSVTNLLIATSDYAFQSIVGRNIENKLRDFLNFDILSIRTLVLQNALKASFSTEKIETKEDKFSIGNLLDNSTVYIGKYIGSDLYLDALMHWSYDESRVNDFMTPGGLVFKPEIGLEIEAPFANIKWKMAPEFTNVFDRKLVSSTSVTLTWKFTF